MLIRVRVLLGLGVLVVANCISACGTAPTAGEIDPVFGGDGIALGPNSSTAATLIADEDGKSYVGGTLERPNGNRSWLVLRFGSYGQVDQSFRSNTAEAFDQLRGSVSSLTFLEDGRVLVAGIAKATTDRSRLLFAVLSKSGRLDRSFGSEGLLSLAEAHSSAVRLAVSDSHVLVAFDGPARMQLSRFSLNGQIDRSYGRRGVHETEFVSWQALADTKGRLLVGGLSQDRSVAVVQRFLSSGVPDSSFGSDGRIVLDALDFPLLAERDGGFVVQSGTSRRGGLSRYDEHGQIDRSFGSKGTAQIGATLRVVSAIRDDQNRLILLQTEAEGPGTGLLRRYTRSGQTDKSLSRGQSEVDVPGGRVVAEALAEGPDQQILVAGDAVINRTTRLFLARYRA